MKLTSNKFTKIIYVVLIILFISSCSSDDDEIIVIPPTGTLEATELLNVSYGNNTLQTYDIYLPEGRNETATKVLILVHGGAWVGGDKADMNYLIDLLKVLFPEYAIVNLNYRLASLTTNAFPMQINDIKSVVSDLKQHQSEYQITTNYGFIGSSAGAHLSMLYTYKHDLTQDVQMVCSIVGPTNFTDTNYVDNPEYSNFVTAIQIVTGVQFSNNPEYYEGLSPYHVAKNTAPPTILFYGGQDDLVPTSQGIDMRDKLNSLGVINEFTLYENEGHGWEGEAATDTKNKLASFITSHF